MKERLLIIDFKYKIIFWSFLFFLTIGFLAPLSGGDWENYLIGTKGLKTIFDTVNEAYMNIDGRIISRFLVYVLTTNKMLFNTLFALLMAGLISSISTVFGKIDNKYYYFIPVIAVLSVGVYTFAGNYTWIEGAVTYTFPAIMSIMYITHLYKKETFNFGKTEIVCLVILNIIIPLFNENIGLAFVAGNIIIFIHRLLKNRKIPPVFLILTVVSLMSLVFMFNSVITNSSNTAFYSLSLFDKITTNIPSIINYVFTNNSFVLIFMLIPINYMLYNKTEKYIYSRLMLVLFNLIPLFSIICNLNSIIPVNINLIISKYDGLFLIEKWYFIFYWILFIGLFIYSVIYIIPEGKKRNYSLLLIIMSLLSVVVLLLFETWTFSMVILFVFGMLAVSSIVITELKINILPWLIKMLIILLLIYYLVIMILTFYIHKTREDYIKQQLNAENKLIYVKANPFYLIWEYNPVCNDKKIKAFRHYYNIPDDTAIEVKYFGIIEDIEKNIKKEGNNSNYNKCR